MMHTGNKMLRSVVIAALLTMTMSGFSPAIYAQDSSKPDTPQTTPVVPAAQKQTPLTQAAPHDKIRVQLHWYPQAQFAGYLMASEKGFFREEGLDVELKWGGADVMPLKELKDGNVEFCSAWLSQAIASRTDDETPCVLLAQLMPKSSMMLVTRKSSGILTPAQMNGKKIGTWGGDFSIAPNAFFEKFNIKPIIITQSSSVLPFIRGVVDVASAMSYNEYHKFLEAGIKPEELTTFTLAEYGLDFPEDGLYTTTEFRKNHPDTCEKLIRAIRKGWQYSFANKDETIKAIVQAATDNNFTTNANHQKWMIDTMEKLIPTQAKDQPWGYLAPSTFAGVGSILQHQKLLKNSPPSYEDFYQPISLSAPATKVGGDKK